MIRVKNQKAISNLAKKSLRASTARNRVAVAAIALTTLLFTALFTIVLSINAAFQDANFRQCGGWSHGTFKYMTQAQFEDIRSDPAIKEWGLRRFLSVLEDEPFRKSHVEVGYSDAHQAHYMWCDPIEGRLPQEGTDEAATDLRVLELLGVEPVLGSQFTISLPVDGHKTTQTFTLCGWWAYDEAITANHILIPESRVEAILEELGLDPSTNSDNSGSWNLDVLFSNSYNIDSKMEELLARHGYQSEAQSTGDNFIATGVNWGYTGSQLATNMDVGTLLAIAALLLLIILTGYLVIYNVFQIAVVNDIRFYGMLKTIGTTPRQLRRIIRQQALSLSVVGVPLGLVLGWGMGALLLPVIVSQLNGLSRGIVALSPLLFVISALFALVTVLLSCARPGRLAGKVSPIEALRYTEGKGGHRRVQRSGKVSLPRMALANLGRSRGKTVVTVLSLSLAALLLTLTVTFTGGFDMNKYLSKNILCDFIVADASYFQTSSTLSSKSPLPQEAIDAVTAQGSITEGGRIFSQVSVIREAVPEDYFRTKYGNWGAEEVDWRVEHSDRNAEGLLVDNAQLYGMERYALDHLTVWEGSLDALYTPGSRAIAAVYHTDDYGALHADSNWARPGDTVSLEYVDEYDYVSPETGESVDPDSGEPYVFKVLRSHTVEYTVAAVVSVPSSLSYRYYGNDEFVLNAETFMADSSTDSVLLYAFDTDDAANADMEAFLRDYTENQATQYDYESRATYAAEFESFRAMFLLLGGALSFVVGLVGVLNFFNAVLTGILTRRREFATLQAIGMTGAQLKTMLIFEGLLYALGSLGLSLALTLLTGPILARVLESMFWFYSYHLTLWPILLMLPIFALLGAVLPLFSYRLLARQTVVERLRQAD